MEDPERPSDEVTIGDEREPDDFSLAAEIRARTAVRPVDMAFLVCAAVTIVLWSGGSAGAVFAIVTPLWCIAWVFWMAARLPRSVWGPLIAAVVTILVLDHQVPDVAFAASRSCLDRAADAEAADGVDDWGEVRLRNAWLADGHQTGTVPGRCGLIRWDDTYVAAMTGSGDGSAVVFVDSGQSRHRGILDHEQHGLVRVDGDRPSDCAAFLGDVRGDATCELGDLGGGWYWFSNWWDPGAT